MYLRTDLEKRFEQRSSDRSRNSSGQRCRDSCVRVAAVLVHDTRAAIDGVSCSRRRPCHPGVDRLDHGDHATTGANRL